MLTLSSGARSLTGLRSVRAFTLLGEVAGLDESQVSDALSAPAALMSPHKSVEVLE